MKHARLPPLLVMLFAVFFAGCVSDAVDGVKGTYQFGREVGGDGIGLLGDGAKEVGSWFGAYDYSEKFDPNDPLYQQSPLDLYDVKPEAKPIVGRCLALADYLLKGSPVPRVTQEEEGYLTEAERAPLTLRLDEWQYVAIFSLLDCIVPDGEITYKEAVKGSSIFRNRTGAQLQRELELHLRRSSAWRNKEAEPPPKP